MSATLVEIDLDWADFEGAGRQSRQYLRELAADKPRLREMVLAVQDDPALLDMCERHQLFDCIVLRDVKSGGRLEIHVSTSDQLDRPHSHCFSFSSLILRGGYQHIWYAPSRSNHGEQEGNGSTSEHEAQPGSDEQEALPAGLVPYVTRFEQPGSCYSIHHSAIHAATATSDTVSLFLRGPREKEDPSIVDPRKDQTSESQSEKQMSADYCHDLRARLERLEVI